MRDMWGPSLGGEDPLEEVFLGNPVQCPCLEHPTDKGAWQATAQGVAQSRTRLRV